MLSIARLSAIANLVLATAALATAPNVIVILTDDQGYGDLSCHGNPEVKTPRLDHLREQGTAFDRFLASPTCSPTRAALLTGRHEFRCGISHTIAGRSLLGRGIPTLAETFRAAGYRTGIIGKWHLGDAWPCRPEDRGFIDVFVHGGGGIGQTPDYWGNDYFDPVIRRGGTWEKTRGYCTDVFFNEALRWLGDQAAAKRPFLLWLATNAPHGPYVAPPGNAAQRMLAAGVKQPAANFYAMIENIDANVGKLLDWLETSGLARDTVVVFLTDNGSAVANWNAGMRGGKCTPNEGGVRVPCFVRWPGKVHAGRVIAEPVAHLDLFPTLAALCGVKMPDAWDGDGVSLAASLTENAPVPAGRVFFTHVGRWSGNTRPERCKSRDFSVRDGRWRLTGVELFDMQADPRQETNLFEQHQDTAADLLGKYSVWWDKILPSLREPVRYGVGSSAQAVTRLTAHDWWPSRADSGADHCVTHGALRRHAAAWAAGTPDATAVCGHWKLQCEQAGNYRVRLWLIPPEAPEAERTGPGRLPAGSAHLRANRREATTRFAAGATGAELRVDLDAGPFDLEAWFERMDDKEHRIGAFFVDVERLGERRTPTIELELSPQAR